MRGRRAGFIRPRISFCFLARQLLDIKMNLDMNTYVCVHVHVSVGVGVGRQNELDLEKFVPNACLLSQWHFN